MFCVEFDSLNAAGLVRGTRVCGFGDGQWPEPTAVSDMAEHAAQSRVAWVWMLCLPLAGCGMPARARRKSSDKDDIMMRSAEGAFKR